jgi:predicted GIY-YIG superfamily endonuclease/ribosomal protein L37E
MPGESSAKVVGISLDTLHIADRGPSVPDISEVYHTTQYPSSVTVPVNRVSSHVYVLLLEQSKIYVGFSARPVGDRFLEHFNSSGAKWTKLYRPLQVLEIRKGTEKDEDVMTLEMMDKYGWWNVRGGQWCQVELTKCPSALLEWQGLKLPPELNKNQRVTCDRCGRDSHSVEDCYARIHSQGHILKASEPVSDDSESDDSVDFCSRCGRNSHSVKRCYARTHIKGHRLSEW